MHEFKKLDVWNMSMKLVEDIYLMTEKFPNDEKYGLTSQIRRSSVSIPSNIAEGAGRNGDKEFANFLSISLGSAFELETQLLIAVRLKFAEEIIINKVLEELEAICKMLNVLRRRFTTI